MTIPFSIYPIFGSILLFSLLLIWWFYSRNKYIKKQFQLNHMAAWVSNCDVMQYIKDTTHAMEPLMTGKQLEFYFHCQPASMMGWIDTDKIDKIIVNMLMDAAKHTEKGGKIVLDVSTNRRYENITIRLGDNGRQYIGIGMKLLRDLVHLHRGTIKSEYYNGQGNTVIIEIPIKKDAYSKSEVNESAASSFNIPNNITLHIPSPTWVSEYKEGNSALQEIMNGGAHSANQEYLERAVQCVNDHLSDSDYSREQFAADMGSSISTLYNKIRAITGKNITNFTRDIRIRAACRMVKENHDLRVSDIAYRVGYKDPKYFATSFKRVMGMQPKEYIEEIKKEELAAETTQPEAAEGQ